MATKLAKKTTTPSSTSPFSEFDRVFENFRRDLEKSFTSFPRIELPSLSKLQGTECDVIDEGKQLSVKVNLPGISKKEIHLNVTDSAMEIHAEHKEESEEKKKNYLRKERSQVAYSRILPLPEKIIPEKVKSKLTDGVLEVILPKVKPTPKSKKRSVTVQ
ncbi:Hsp20/alpha crystallin family protein [Nitrosopumilus sp.]|uniref:Hsp20/alpha crystallin family protein n=1 Tax=Nitrosopumilus sp. TaxID=2024843 RepID=UPI003B5A9810